MARPSHDVMETETNQHDPSTAKASVQLNAGRQRWIAEAAYYKAMARGFVPGYETADWLAAEQDYLDMLVAAFVSDSMDDGNVLVASLQRLAEAVGVHDADLIFSETALIRMIQAARYETPCFRANIGQLCQGQASCPWRGECLKLVAEWCR